MLTIKNIEKIINKECGYWKIFEVQTEVNEYVISVMMPSRIKADVYLQRFPISHSNEYELWYWKSPVTAERLFFSIEQFKTLEKCIAAINLLLI
jgi:hypothetical protein